MCGYEWCVVVWQCGVVCGGVLWCAMLSVVVWSGVWLCGLLCGDV